LSDDSLAYPSHAGLRDNETRDSCRVHNPSRMFYHSANLNKNTLVYKNKA